MPPDIYLLSPPDGLFIEQLDELVREGFEYFQYRRPGLTDRERYGELSDVRSILEGTPTKLIVNNRPDLARSVGADGVHLGEDDLPVNEVKQAWPELTVGRTHRVDDDLVRGADYYGIGPVFSSFSKDLDVEPAGWDGIRRVLSRTRKPVYAIGGIDASRLDDVPENLAGIGVIGAVWDRSDPASGLRELKEGLRH